MKENKMKWPADELVQYSPEELIYTLADAYFAHIEQAGEAVLAQFSDEQHTLMAYVYFDSQVQEGGFVQLIASGYGEYIFANPVANSLRRWKVKQTPKIIDKAAALYQQCGAEIEAQSDAGVDVAGLRQQFNEFEELDADYYDCAEDDMAIVKDYIVANWSKFDWKA